jgi:hypothetical protein
MILFSTLPHKRTTPRCPAETMVKKSHEKIIASKTMIPSKIVAILGPLEYGLPGDPSGMVHLLAV